MSPTWNRNVSVSPVSSATGAIISIRTVMLLILPIGNEHVAFRGVCRKIHSLFAQVADGNLEQRLLAPLVVADKGAQVERVGAWLQTAEVGMVHAGHLVLSRLSLGTSPILFG